MSDDSFGQDFIWYEWSFIAPEDLPGKDLEVTGDRYDSSHMPQSPYVEESSDVWQTYP